jgi:hypothetical protein
MLLQVATSGEIRPRDCAETSIHPGLLKSTSATPLMQEILIGHLNARL